MNHATSAATAAALLLQPGTGGPDAVAGTTRQLRLALDAHLLVQVDGWLADGPDAEQLNCLADVLHQRVQRDAAFRRLVTEAASSAATADALFRLAAACRDRGHWGTARWCEERGADLRRGRLGGGWESNGLAPAGLAGEGSEPNGLAPAAAGRSPAAVRRLADLHAQQQRRSDAAEVPDEDAGFDFVSTVLHGTEHGDAAMLQWEEAAGALVDSGPAVLGAPAPRGVLAG